MKKYLSIAASIALGTAAIAQPCTTTRFASDVFAGVTTTSAITYGSNVTYNGTTQTLTLDLYQPTGDVAVTRPLIIWAHGGSFVGGASTDADVDSLSHRFARKGYVCASINYRLGTASFDSVGLIPAVVRAVQDLKASIRYFYKDAATANLYKIDTNNIFIGGSSAGSITALHSEYMKKNSEIYTWLTPSQLTTLGGLDGTSGNAGYSIKVKGVIDLCGALARASFFEAGSTPLCSMHGTSDATVPYGHGMVNPGIPIMNVDGSRIIYAQSLLVGVQDNFYTFLGAPHVPYAGPTPKAVAYMDTTVNFVRDFLIGRMNIVCTPLQPANPAFNAGIQNMTVNLFEDVYPNPSSDIVNVLFVNNNAIYTVELFDIAGRIVKSDKTSQPGYTLEKGNLVNGVYFLKVTNAKGEASVRKIIFN